MLARLEEAVQGLQVVLCFIVAGSDDTSSGIPDASTEYYAVDDEVRNPGATTSSKRH